MQNWVATISSDPATILFVAAAVLLIAATIGVVFATRAQRRRERQSAKGTSENPDEAAIAHWVEDGRQLFSLWQERVERLAELQSRLAAMAHEIELLKTQVRRVDELRAENLRLVEENEAFRFEQDQLRAVVARIGELVQRASEARRGPAGEATAPEVGP